MADKARVCLERHPFDSAHLSLPVLALLSKANQSSVTLQGADD
jgi:hypothetical protein